MECSEAAFGSGQAVVGWSWLGGPVVVALCLHLAACVAATFAVKAGVRFFLARVVAVISYVLERLLAERSRAGRCVTSQRFKERVPSRFELLCGRRLRGRAPPILAASV